MGTTVYSLSESPAISVLLLKRLSMSQRLGNSTLEVYVMNAVAKLTSRPTGRICRFKLQLEMRTGEIPSEVEEVLPTKIKSSMVSLGSSCTVCELLPSLRYESRCITWVWYRPHKMCCLDIHCINEAMWPLENPETNDKTLVGCKITA